MYEIEGNFRIGTFDLVFVIFSDNRSLNLVVFAGGRMKLTALPGWPIVYIP